MTLVDARGVPIAPGDTAIYGFSVSRSVAMAEAVVLAEELECTCRNDYGDHETRAQRLACPRPNRGVSLTASGRVRLRVIRRSYSSGEKPTVDVAPDRLVVLKPTIWATPVLPPSPLPTQAEEVRAYVQGAITSLAEDLRSDVVTWGADFATLAEFHDFAARRLLALRRELKALDEE